MLISYKVKSVAGAHVPNPWSLGNAQMSVIGYDAVAGEPKKTVISRTAAATRKYLRSAEPCLVAETRDGFLRAAITHGDLEYVETVGDAGTKAEKKFRDPALVRLSNANVAKRAKAAAAEVARLALAATADATDLAKADAEHATAMKATGAAEVTPDKADKADKAEEAAGVN